MAKLSKKEKEKYTDAWRKQNSLLSPATIQFDVKKEEEKSSDVLSSALKRAVQENAVQRQAEAKKAVAKAIQDYTPQKVSNVNVAKHSGASLVNDLSSALKQAGQAILEGSFSDLDTYNAARTGNDRWLQMDTSKTDALAEKLAQQRMMTAKQAAQQQALIDARYKAQNFSTAQRFASDAGRAIGQVAPALIPGVGTPYLLGLGFGAGTNQAINDGATLEQANDYGALSAAKEVAIEKAFGGLKGMKALINPAKVTDKIANPVLRTGADLALRSAGEGMEEVVATAVDPTLQRMTYNPDAQDASRDEMLYSALLGAIASGGINIGVTGLNKVADFRKNNQANKGNQQKISQNQGISPQNAQNGAGLVQGGQTTKYLPTPEKPAQNQFMEAEKIRKQMLAEQKQLLSQKRALEQKKAQMEQAERDNLYREIKNLEENIALLRGTQSSAFDDALFNAMDEYTMPEQKPQQTLPTAKRQNNVERERLVQELSTLLNDPAKNMKRINEIWARLDEIEEAGKVQQEEKLSFDMPMSERTLDNVSNPKVKAYQSTHPEVKAFFREQAEIMLNDLNNMIDGGREYGIDPETRTVNTVRSQTRAASSQIERLLNAGMTKAQIRDGLERIIRDNGAENTANAKKVETTLDDALANGYQSMQGQVPKNLDYVYHNADIGKMKNSYNQLNSEESFANSADPAGLINELEYLNQNITERQQLIDAYSELLPDMSVYDSMTAEELHNEMDKLESASRYAPDEIAGEMMKRHRYLELLEEGRVNEFIENENMKTHVANMEKQLADKKLSLKLPRASDEMKNIKKKLDEIEAKQAGISVFNKAETTPEGYVMLPRPTVRENRTVAENTTVADDFSTVEYKDFDVSKLPKEVSDFYNQVGQVGKKAGFNVRVVTGIENDANGMFDGQGNILVDGNKMTDEKTISRVIGHEGFHFLKDTDEHKFIIDIAIKDGMQKDGLTKDQLIQKKIEDYYNRSKGNVVLDRDGALDEIGAEFMEKILTDPKTAERIWNQNPTLAQRIKWWLEDMVSKFRKTSAENPDAEIYRKALDAYSRGLRNMQYQRQTENGTMYSLSSKDSSGRQLTTEQAEYFKNSKVRDENGNLKVMYHGTSSYGFNVFDYGKVKFGLFGSGFYFTDNESVAESYTEKGKGDNKGIYKVYLNITNPIDMDAPANAEWYDVDLDGEDITEYLEVPEIKQPTNEDYFRALKNYCQDSGMYRYEAEEYIQDTILGMGFDGISHIGGGRYNKKDETRHRVYIAFEQEQIKNIDNQNPTSNPDIRYSLPSDITTNKQRKEKLAELEQESKEVVAELRKFKLEPDPDETRVYRFGKTAFHVVAQALDSSATEADYNRLYQKAVDGGYAEQFRKYEELKKEIEEVTALGKYGTDSNDKLLTKQQAEYFENSIVVDDYGRPVVVYHGSPNEFYEFDWAKVGKNGTQEGRGFYFTDDASIAEQYGSDTGGVREFYLRMEKPLNGLKVTMKKSEVKKLLKETDKFMKKHFDDEYFLSNYGDTDYYGKEKVINDAVNNLFEYNNSDSDILYDIINTAGIRDNEDTAAFMKFITEKFGYDGILTEWSNWETGEVSRIYVTFDSNNAKLTSNQNPTNNPDMRYSLDELVDEYGALPKGEDPYGTNRDIDVPRQTADDNRVSKWAGTAMEAEQVDDITVSMIERDMEQGRFTYEPTGNQEQINRADGLIHHTGWQKQVENFRNKYSSGERMTADDIVLGERLIQEAQSAGDYETAVDLIADIAAIGTELGQAVQALSVLKRLTPEGKVKALKRVEERINAGLIEQRKDPVKLPEGMAEQMLQAESQQMQSEIWDECVQELANQVPATLADKINAWRYLAMLSNPKTHIRNMVGNSVMRGVSAVKRGIQTNLENRLLTAGEERYAELNRNVPQEYFDFAEWSWENEGKHRAKAGGGRYNDAIGQIEQNKRIFNNDKLETARKTNTELLEAEDMWFKKKTYIDSLARYMHTNGLSPSVLQNTASHASYKKGCDFALKEAYKGTFQEASKVANLLAQMEHSSPAAKLLMGGVMPFKKTPINILKRGVEYSPVGLMNGLYKLRHDVQTGKCTPAEAIDSIAAGLTGTGIMIVGYFMASMGWITAGAGEDDERKQWYDQSMGSQNYALVLPNGGTATIDWLAPSVMPLMAGAELYSQLTSENPANENISAVTSTLEAISKVANPVLEMSMLQGVTDALQSYNSGTTGVLSDLITSTATSYGGQFVPAVVGAAARTIDDTVRSSYAPKDSAFTKTGEKFARQQMNKIPFVSMLNNPSVDVWGNEVERAGGNIIGRAFNNFLNPATYSSDKRTELDKKLNELYEATGNSGVLPSSGTTYINESDSNPKIYLSADEYMQYGTTKGQKSYQYVNAFVNSAAYSQLADEDKAEIISDLYSLANYQAKKEALNGRGYNYVQEQYEKVLKSKMEPQKYYIAKYNMDLIADNVGEGQKKEQISYLKGLQQNGTITDEQCWYLRRAMIGKFSKSELASCPYDWIKQL